MLAGGEKVNTRGCHRGHGSSRKKFGSFFWSPLPVKRRQKVGRDQSTNQRYQRGPRGGCSFGALRPRKRPTGKGRRNDEKNKKGFEQPPRLLPVFGKIKKGEKRGIGLENKGPKSNPKGGTSPC